MCGPAATLLFVRSYSCSVGTGVSCSVVTVNSTVITCVTGARPPPPAVPAISFVVSVDGAGNAVMVGDSRFRFRYLDRWGTALVVHFLRMHSYLVRFHTLRCFSFGQVVGLAHVAAQRASRARGLRRKCSVICYQRCLSVTTSECTVNEC